MNDETVLLLGAVAYDPQVEALINGHIHVAWNSPLAWVRARRLAKARGLEAQAVAMRDTDSDLTSVVVVREDGPIKAVTDLKGRVVAVGSVDSPQATLLPLAHLHTQGLDTTGFDIVVHYHN